ncbi:hypothetical protein WJX84_012350 [Apatococcus fuscideae]|uniref:Uncharacterized protein n=1 Tax=Apatococcus fuscideae TaxID=2026836 RepID=A0AAW1SY12_9CHLO
MSGAHSALAHSSLSLHQLHRQWQRPSALISRQPCSLCQPSATQAARSVSCQALVAQGPEDDSDADRPADSFSVGAFTRELEARGVVQQRSVEAQEAADFDGQQLLDVLLAKYERSYDLAFVQRRFAGKRFIALNILWHYKEQASFPLSEEQLCRASGLCGCRPPVELSLPNTCGLDLFSYMLPDSSQCRGLSGPSWG